MHINSDRAYNMILTERTFGPTTHCYALLGKERATNSWNLLGGKKEIGDKTRGVTACRELFEESCPHFDKRGNVGYWQGLSSYEFEKHKVFIHNPGNLSVKIDQLNKTAQQAIKNTSLPYCYKEMSEYTLIKLSDLISLANGQKVKGNNEAYSHPKNGNINIDGWLLYTLKNANISSLNSYRY
ncbi:MAG: NUDIX hydrolase [Parachlamydiaceae bacterium]|nr:NUDIX hydrolase [Parachlamydiaceae bacterium]